MKHAWILVFMGLIIPTQAHAATAKATIQGTGEGSKISGWAFFNDTDKGLEIKIDLFGAPPGTHGIHIHEKGSCADLGNGAGGHYNPDGVKHGMITKDGPLEAHMGDLGNIDIGPDGNGSIATVVPQLTISGGKYNVDGRTVIFHEKIDDFGQPTGNAGSRIGCGVIEAGAK